MQLYGYITGHQLGGVATPAEATAFADISIARRSLFTEARRHFETQYSTLELRLFVGEPEGDEAKFGYPEADAILVAEWSEAPPGFTIRHLGA